MFEIIKLDPLIDHADCNIICWIAITKKMICNTSTLRKDGLIEVTPDSIHENSEVIEFYCQDHDVPLRVSEDQYWLSFTLGLQ